jgi:Cu2+-containing amine oxidase
VQHSEQQTHRSSNYLHQVRHGPRPSPTHTDQNQPYPYLHWATPAGFWKWNFIATQRSEQETHSSSVYTQSDLSSPPTCLTDYIDGESIRRKDLVVWINSGLYHVPMAEDAPVTPASGHNQLGFSLM